MGNTEQLNLEGISLFRNGQYERAAEKFRVAINAANTTSAADDTTTIYFSNLAAAYLELQEFTLALETSHIALLRDATYIAARYRRAMARKGLGLLLQCLIDLYTIITMDPADSKARYAFSQTWRMCDSAIEGTQLLGSHEIAKIAFPPAYGAKPGAGCSIRGSATEHRHTKSCSQRRVSSCCSGECHRADWPPRKQVSSAFPPHPKLVVFSKRLTHPYIQDLLKRFAVSAMGLLTGQPLPCPGLLIVHVGLKALPGANTHRLTIQQIQVVPVFVMRGIQLSRSMSQGSTTIGHMGHLVQILIREDVDVGNCFQHSTDIEIRPQDKVMDPGEVHLYSHSLRQTRSFGSDVDVLFRALEDEIELDVTNYYGLRG
ncbi:hypothetical protein DFH09DRAFT_1497619 [Mycena vulgaris]|nr:hypothetical protein DFH09DRAFT_1497619 [Mycena vulgaris]